MAIAITLQGIDKAIENLSYRNTRSLKSRLVQAIRAHYHSETDITTLAAIDTDDLVCTLWDTRGNLDIIKNRRKNFSSIKSSVKVDLNKLHSQGKNTEGITIGHDNIFEMSEEAKADFLKAFVGKQVLDASVDLANIENVLQVINDMLDQAEAMDQKGITLGKRADLQALLQDMAKKIGRGPENSGGTGGGGDDFLKFGPPAAGQGPPQPEAADTSTKNAASGDVPRAGNETASQASNAPDTPASDTAVVTAVEEVSVIDDEALEEIDEDAFEPEEISAEVIDDDVAEVEALEAEDDLVPEALDEDQEIDTVVDEYAYAQGGSEDGNDGGGPAPGTGGGEDAVVDGAGAAEGTAPAEGLSGLDTNVNDTAGMGEGAYGQGRQIKSVKDRHDGKDDEGPGAGDTMQKRGDRQGGAKKALDKTGGGPETTTGNAGDTEKPTTSTSVVKDTLSQPAPGNAAPGRDNLSSDPAAAEFNPAVAPQPQIPFETSAADVETATDLESVDQALAPAEAPGAVDIVLVQDDEQAEIGDDLETEDDLVEAAEISEIVDDAETEEFTDEAIEEELDLEAFSEEIPEEVTEEITDDAEIEDVDALLDDDLEIEAIDDLTDDEDLAEIPDEDEIEEAEDLALAGDPETGDAGGEVEMGGDADGGPGDGLDGGPDLGLAGMGGESAQGGNGPNTGFDAEGGGGAASGGEADQGDGAQQRQQNTKGGQGSRSLKEKEAEAKASADKAGPDAPGERVSEKKAPSPIHQPDINSPASAQGNASAAGDAPTPLFEPESEGEEQLEGIKPDMASEAFDLDVETTPEVAPEGLLVVEDDEFEEIDELIDEDLETAMAAADDEAAEAIVGDPAPAGQEDEGALEDPEEDEPQDKARLLAEAFNRSLAARDKYFNQYLFVPESDFLLGHHKPQPDERPRQKAALRPFYMGKFPVINALFEVFVEKTGYRTSAEKKGCSTVYEARSRKSRDDDTGNMKLVLNATLTKKDVDGACWYQPLGPGSTLHNRRRHPVVHVSLEDAIAFAAWTGKRLPTENEWEAAARTHHGLLYPWGSDFKAEALNFEDSHIGDNSEVDRYEAFANEWGIADMLGNIWEWTLDIFESGHETKDPSTWYVVKGGSFLSTADINSASRRAMEGQSSSNIIGFRCLAF